MIGPVVRILLSLLRRSHRPVRKNGRGDYCCHHLEAKNNIDNILYYPPVGKHIYIQQRTLSVPSQRRVHAAPVLPPVRLKYQSQVNSDAYSCHSLQTVNKQSPLCHNSPPDSCHWLLASSDWGLSVMRISSISTSSWKGRTL